MYNYFFLSYSTRHCVLDILFLVSFHTNIHTQTHKQHFDFHSTAVIYFLLEILPYSPNPIWRDIPYLIAYIIIELYNTVDGEDR